MNNWGKLKLCVLYKGHTISKSAFTALIKAYFALSTLLFDKHKIRVIVKHELVDFKVQFQSTQGSDRYPLHPDECAHF